MNKIFLILILWGPRLFAQCNINDEFSILPDPSTVGCASFDITAGAGWIRSHGSPQILGTSGQASNVAYMWSRNVGGNITGEGIFQNYIFAQGHSYHVTMRARAQGASGTMGISAATGLVEGPPASCGGFVQSPTTNVTIGYSSTIPSTNTTYEFDFTPLQDYSQIYLYPYTFSTSQYDLYLEQLLVCEVTCSTIRIFNETVPRGNTKALQIIAGSSAGSGGSTGIVTPDPAFTTTFRATSEIILLPDFSAEPTGNREFVALIEDCDYGSASLSSIINRNQLIQYQNRNSEYNRISSTRRYDSLDLPGPSANQKIKIFPNPTRSNVTVYHAGISSGYINIYNPTGVLLRSVPIKNNSSQSNIDLGNQKGLYIIKVVDRKTGKEEKQMVFKE